MSAPMDALHAIILSDQGAVTVSGKQLSNNPAREPGDLPNLLDWLFAKRNFTRLGSPPQIWVHGGAATAVGAPPDPDDPRKPNLVNLVAALHARGWEVRGELSPQLTVAKTIGGSLKFATVVLAPYARAITRRPDDLGILHDHETDDVAAPEETARRVLWAITEFDVLPSVTAAGTGANLLDKIYNRREKAKRGAVPIGRGTIPEVDLGEAGGVLEPAEMWVRDWLLPEEADHQDQDAVLLDQRAAYLAAASSVELPHGPVAPLGADQARSAALRLLHQESEPRSLRGHPYTLWEVELPALRDTDASPLMPPPHPLMRLDEPFTALLTGQSLLTLTDPTGKAGAGLDPDALAVSRGWRWESSTRMLERWATDLREARARAVEAGDEWAVKHIGHIYKHYIGRMESAASWGERRARHHQPVWAATIRAHTRASARKQAWDIAEKHGLHPLYTNTDSWLYLAPQGTILVDADARLGKLVEKGRTRVTPSHAQAMDTAFLSRETLDPAEPRKHNEAVIAVGGLMRDMGLKPQPAAPQQPANTKSSATQSAGETRATAERPGKPVEKPTERAPASQADRQLARKAAIDALKAEGMWWAGADIHPEAVRSLQDIIDKEEFKPIPSDNPTLVPVYPARPVERPTAPEPEQQPPATLLTKQQVYYLLALLLALLVATAAIWALTQ